VLKVVDATALVMPVGFAAGKLGCFLAGCCYGKRCDGFPGMRFPPGSLAYDTQREAGQIGSRATHSLPVHPAQLYEFAFAALLFAGLWWLGRRSKRPGEVTLAMAAGYSAWRFAIEFLRDDPGRHGFNAGISDSQVMALIVLVVSGLLWAFLRRRAPEATRGA
jgi:phosphatidylglycerol:prolipoprotein diacylglycerol transferase